MHLKFGNGENKKEIICSKLAIRSCLDSCCINNMFWCQKITINAFVINLHQDLLYNPHLHDPEMFFKLFWLTTFPHLERRKEQKKKKKRRNIHNKFSSQSVFGVVSFLFFYILDLLSCLKHPQLNK